MKTLKSLLGVVILTLVTSYSLQAQENDVIYVKMAEEQHVKKESLKTYLIEREIPNAGDLTEEQLKSISQKSCSVLREMGPGIEWLHSYVTDNKVYCLYKAENMELIKSHAEQGGFPANYIVELSTTIDPTTAQ